MSTVKEGIIQRAVAGEIDGVSPNDAKSTFALDSSTAVVKRTGNSGTPRPSEPPTQKIQDYRLIADTDPHIGEGINTLVDYLVGSGFSIQPANIVGTDQEQNAEDISNLKSLVETSNFQDVLIKWVWHALVDGTSFIEIVVEDDVFKPKVLSAENISIQTDEFGNTTGYIYETPDNEEIEFGPYDLAVLKFHEHPGEDFGRSLIEKCEEQVDMLRDMEIDMARFIATKAYPPIIWQLGTEDRPWSENQIDSWLSTVENIQPDSMLAVGHDVDHDVVGVTSTSSSAGAMRLEPTFQHLLKRIYTALGLPAFLGNIDSGGTRGDSVTNMPKFDRRIQRYRSTIRSAVRNQIFVSIMAGDADPAELSELPPQFEFGQHSSEEERLDAEMAVTLVNNGLLTFEAAARRIGIDPETELPQEGELDEHIRKIQQLAGKGDNIQNPDGGSPTDTGGGGNSADGAVKTRQNPEKDTSDSDSRPQQDISNE
ncbi:phage portal protein family protein [Halocatena halophila]|uniref:phage portal protein family protein n=1 Tax=Halocatena halophila TaxID=2814576 RepID=UPI002ED14415